MGESVWPSQCGRVSVAESVWKEASGDEWAGRGQQPVEGATDLVGVVPRCAQVAVNVFDGGFQHEDGVAQLVELGTGDDELGLAQTELGGATAGLVVHLLA